MKPIANAIWIITGVLVALAIAAAIYIWSGYYNVAADDPHTRMTSSLLETVRDRSIEARSADISVPKLDAPEMIAKGAALYSEMCVGCHLAPGVEQSELREGLNPQPPDLAKHGVDDPREAFWIMKHGIKMTAMPAWGVSHDDATLWNIVAFLRVMPTMSAAQYERLAQSGDHEEEGPHHAHGAATSHQH
ncbi:MAG: c-type cytochrome [Burkholderiaceae bacterium]